MMYEWVVEALHHIVGKFLQLGFWQVKCFNQFLIHNHINEFRHHLIAQTFLHNVQSGQITYRCQNRVRAIQQGYFTFVVWFFVRNKQYIQTGFIGRKFFCNAFRSFNYE